MRCCKQNMFFGALYVMVCTTLAACVAATPIPQSVDHIVSGTDVQAPELPVLCKDSTLKSHHTKEFENATLYIFTSDWCDACDRALEMLETISASLTARGISVHHVVTGEGDSCFAAARVARRSVFPYSAGNRRIEEAWALRSTPTLWLVDNNSQALLYVEGRPSATKLLEAIDRRVQDLSLKHDP